jgi:hypothetical protein
MKKALFPLLVFAVVIYGLAQETFTVEGRIFDKNTKEPLPAYVMLEESATGSTADVNGYFRMTIKTPKDNNSIKLLVWLIGYKKTEVTARIGELLSIALEPEPISTYEVVVNADSVVSDSNNQKTVTLNKMDVYTIPGTAADPVQASQILPGVNAHPDTSSLIIRGGAPDEVGYFFDGIEIRHPFLSETMHESYFSIFDNQVVERFNISTSGIHPKYGDALSGAMDITAKDTMAKGEGGLGLSVLGLNSYIGWPVAKDISFVGSYDRGFSDLLTRLNSRGGEREFRTEHAFGKFNIRLNKSNQIRIYGLSDGYLYSEGLSFMADSRNTLAAASWTSTPARNFVSRVLLSRTRYDVSMEIEQDLRVGQNDDVRQAKWDALWDLGRHFLEFGADIQSRRIETSILDKDQWTYQEHGTRLGFYVNDKLRVSDHVFMNAGGRINSLDILNSRWSFDPRVSLAYVPTKCDILRLSAGVYHQFGDYFTLRRNPDLLPKSAVHLAMSYDRIKQDAELRLTLYDKEYRHLFLNQTEGLVSSAGCGYARGAEFFIKKTKNQYDAIFVYNFLRSRRKENDTASLAPSPYEITHSLTGIFRWKWKTWSIGVRYSQASGRPFTPLAGRERDSQSEAYIPVWGAPYSERYPSYKRMDINGSKTMTIFNRLAVIYFGITNVLDNKNILRYEYGDDYSGRKDQQSIFGRALFIGVYIPFF